MLSYQLSGPEDPTLRTACGVQYSPMAESPLLVCPSRGHVALTTERSIA